MKGQVRISRRMKEAGLSVAAAEANRSSEMSCHTRHSQWFRYSGYKFCPICGISIIPQITCKDCGREFQNITTFDAHIDWHKAQKRTPQHCPNCNHANHGLERIRFGATFDTWHCNHCENDFKWNPVRGNYV